MVFIPLHLRITLMFLSFQMLLRSSFFKQNANSSIVVLQGMTETGKKIYKHFKRPDDLR